MLLNNHIGLFILVFFFFVLELGCGSVRAVSGLPAEAQF